MPVAAAWAYSAVCSNIGTIAHENERTLRLASNRRRNWPGATDTLTRARRAGGTEYASRARTTTFRASSSLTPSSAAARRSATPLSASLRPASNRDTDGCDTPARRASSAPDIPASTRSRRTSAPSSPKPSTTLVYTSQASSQAAGSFRRGFVKLGGPNGIVGIDPIRAFGHQITGNKGYYYLLVILLVLTMAVLRQLDTSRTGRAWRAVREDPLAAASMTITVNRVKLMAFAFGAMVAALAGTIFAAQQISVFPTDFDTPILILIYAGLILGGAGSIAGAAVGALVIMIIYDGLLRSPTDSGYLFYGLILLTLVVKLRPWRRLGAVLAATAALGFAAHAIVGAISASAVAGGPQSTGWIATALRDWVIVPAKAEVAGNCGYVLLVCLLIALVQAKGRWRTILLVPTIYLASFVWETRLIVEPAITRQLMIGAILIVMMNARPQGLLGARRVEVVT